MATKMTVFLEDDLEGGPADETVRFGIGGTAYEMDLNAKNAAAFRRQLALTSSTPTGLAEHTAPAGADCVQPGTERGLPGVGKDQGIALRDCGPSRPTSSGSTKPPREDGDVGGDRHGAGRPHSTHGASGPVWPRRRVANRL